MILADNIEITKSNAKFFPKFNQNFLFPHWFIISIINDAIAINPNTFQKSKLVKNMLNEIKNSKVIPRGIRVLNTLYFVIKGVINQAISPADNVQNIKAHHCVVIPNRGHV